VLVVGCISLLPCGPMPYQILPLTHHQVSNGALQPFADLKLRSEERKVEIENQQGLLPVQQCQMEVFFINPSTDPATFKTFSVRFGNDLLDVLFFNECAVRACQYFKIPLHTVDQIADAELPRGIGTVQDCPYYSITN